MAIPVPRRQAARRKQQAMPSFNPFGAGKKVYGQGSYAPTKGPIGASGMQGYAQRDLRNQSQGTQGGRPVGQYNPNLQGLRPPPSGGYTTDQGPKDPHNQYQGQTQIQQGGRPPTMGGGEGTFERNPQQQKRWDGFHPLGAAARARNAGSQDTGFKAGKGGDIKQQHAQSVIKQNADQKQKNYEKEQDQKQKNYESEQLVKNGPQPQSMQATANGTLELPYDEDAAMGLLGYKQDFNSNMINLNQQSQKQALEYGSAKRNAGIGYEDQKRRTLNDNAGRGMAFSSGYGQDVSNNARDYNNYMMDMENSNSLFGQGISMDRMNMENGLNDYLSQLAYGQGMKLDDDAGTLGYGQATNNAGYDKIEGPRPVGKHKPKPKPKPGAKKSPERNKAEQIIWDKHHPRGAAARRRNKKGK